MAAGDYFVEVGDPGTATTLSAPGYTAGGTSINVGSTTNWPSVGEAVVFAIDEAQIVDGRQSQIAGTYNEFEGTVASATSVSNVDWKRGSGDRSYSAGSLTRVYIPVTSERENRLVTGILVHADQDGTLKAGAVDNAAVLASDVVTTAKILDANVTEAKLTHRPSEYLFDHVASGGVWSGDAYASTRNASMTAVTAYIGGTRGTVSAVTARSFTASKDTYVDILNSSGTFSLVYTEVANNAASPALAANSIRLAIIVTGASNIANVGSVNQGETDKVLPIASSIPYAVTDSLGNLICPRDPNRRVLGYRQITGNFTVSSGSPTLISNANGTLSVPVIIPSNRKIRIYVRANYQNYATATGSSYVSIFETSVAGTLLAQTSATSATAAAVLPVFVERISDAYSGSKTFVASLNGDAAVLSTFAASTTNPGHIVVELV